MGCCELQPDSLHVPMQSHRQAAPRSTSPPFAFPHVEIHRSLRRSFQFHAQHVTKQLDACPLHKCFKRFDFELVVQRLVRDPVGPSESGKHPQLLAMKRRHLFQRRCCLTPCATIACEHRENECIVHTHPSFHADLIPSQPHAPHRAKRASCKLHPSGSILLSPPADCPAAAPWSTAQCRGARVRGLNVRAPTPSCPR